MVDKVKHDKPYSKDQTDFKVIIEPRKPWPPRYRVWVNDYKLPIGADSIESIKEIIEAFKDEGIHHIDECIEGEWKQINYYI